MKRYIGIWKQAFTVEGRATRSDYWLFYFTSLLIVFVLAILDVVLGSMTSSGDPILASVFRLLLIVPSVTLAIRRLHDMDYVGWWVLFPLVIIALLFSTGSAGDNRFGSNPRIKALPTPVE